MTMSQCTTLEPISGLDRSDCRSRALDAIRSALDEYGLTLAEAVARKQVYFRVSITSRCNFSCVFCHNEGAPVIGQMDFDDYKIALDGARDVGFQRLQLTGGEPLLRKDIGDFIQAGRKYMDDVGVTTNGSLLSQRLDGMLESGLTRLHISLQSEALEEAGEKDRWGVPPWLGDALQAAEDGRVALRLNLPVPARDMGKSEAFIETLKDLRCDLKVFTVLPEGRSALDDYPVEALESIVDEANAVRRREGLPSRVEFRGYRPPAGIRCKKCLDSARCKEQSRSLRLGSDLVLRPCLATREWDSPLRRDAVRESLEDAALLSLDYHWPEREKSFHED